MSVNNSKAVMFFNITGVDKIEAIWFHKLRGTELMNHPVAIARAKSFLSAVGSLIK